VSISWEKHQASKHISCGFCKYTPRKEQVKQTLLGRKMLGIRSKEQIEDNFS